MPLIERSTTDGVLHIRWQVSASVDEVWGRLVDPAAMPEWLGQPQVAEFRTDGELIVDHGDGYLCRSHIITCEAPRHLSLTWHFPDEPETRLDMTIDGSEPAVLHLTHSGLDGHLPSYAVGWLVHLTYFEASVHHTPLPTGQFWNLYETVQRIGS